MRVDFSAELNIRERIQPKRSDAYYLVLSDLRSFLGRFQSNEPVRILDYGAGNSPYRALFPNSSYERADCAGSECKKPDYILPEDSSIDSPEQAFDLVLSTQVAEHVSHPKNYFSEAFRVLKPGGRFLVTTHGTWEDHGVPYDFQRWTADGLRRDLEEAGFRNVQLFKLTTSSRCFLFLLSEWFRTAASRRGRFFPRLFTAISGSLIQATRPVIHLAADRWFSACRIVEGPEVSRHSMYLVVAALGYRPALPK